jgi:hypothetical protein
MVIFDKSQIAPCGMNCGTCIAYLREINKCPGCRIAETEKPKTRASCIVKNCRHLKETDSEFCGNCNVFPCKRITQLDKRYKAKYRTSFIFNLQMIKEKGIDSFLEFESNRRTCPACGKVVSVHRNKCLTCNYDLTNYAI